MIWLYWAYFLLKCKKITKFIILKIKKYKLLGKGKLFIIFSSFSGRIRNSPEANEDASDGDEDGALSLGLFPGERPTLDDRAVFRLEYILGLGPKANLMGKKLVLGGEFQETCKQVMLQMLQYTKAHRCLSIILSDFYNYKI